MRKVGTSAYVRVQLLQNQNLFLSLKFITLCRVCCSGYVLNRITNTKATLIYDNFQEGDSNSPTTTAVIQLSRGPFMAPSPKWQHYYV